VTRVLITGGSGFIGSHLIEELEAHLFDVISLDIRRPRRRHAAVTYVQLDFTQHAALCRLFDRVRPEMVCHLGAIPSVQESVRDAHASMTANVAGTYSVAEAARRAGARRMLFASSAAVYGATALEQQGDALSEVLPLRPLSPYALAKKQGEEIVRMWSSDIWTPIDGVSLRFFNVFGPRQRRDAAYATCIERFLAQWRAGEPLTIVPDGQQRRDMVFVTDVVRAIRLALEAPGPWRGESINIGGGRNYSIVEMAQAIGGTGYPQTFIDPRPGEVRSSLADIRVARERLGWAPRVAFADGIEQLKQSVPVAS
jgi:nucleoside-diphosphate-sugar epimerase